MADKAYITPRVLKWARESARMPLEVAAGKVPIAPERLNEWEVGEKQPTIKQAEKLAKIYRRPFALFFLPNIPRDFQPLQDFRRETARQLSTASIFIIREIQQKQAWIRDVYEDNNEDPLPFVGKFTSNSDPKIVAEDILETLGINPQNYIYDNPIKEWIEKAESKGIFISRTSFINSHLTLDSEEIQGFTIADNFAPFIFINSDDWTAPQLFTLVHELAHIWIAASGISNETEIGVRSISSQHPIELFCNEVAANALMPDSIMNSLESNVFDSGNNIFKVSKKLGVSSFALLVRALNRQQISLEIYKYLKKEADKDFKLFLEREAEKKAQQKLKKGGGPSYYMLLVNKNSHLFTRIVMDAFRGGAIQPTLASSLLNLQVNNFSKLEKYLY